MAERRSLLEGLKAPQGVDPELAKQFIYGEKEPLAKPTKAQNGGPPATEGRDAVKRTFHRCCEMVRTEKGIEQVSPPLPD
jgi:hypothetical protein